MPKAPINDGLTSQQRYRQSDKYKATRKARIDTDKYRAYMREAVKKSRIKNIEKIKELAATPEFKAKRAAYNKSLSKEMRVAINEKSKIFYEKNKDLILLKMRERYKNPEVKLMAFKKSRKRRSQLSFATPEWANKKAMEEIYLHRGEYHVDHIIPIKGKLVSGLHCAANLQYLTNSQNKSKYNNFDENKLPSICEALAFDSDLHYSAVGAVMRGVL